MSTSGYETENSFTAFSCTAGRQSVLHLASGLLFLVFFIGIPTGSYAQTPPAKKDLDARLLVAVREGREPEVRELLAAGANPAVSESDGFSALHTAVSDESGYAIARLLLNHGGNVNASTQMGETPLHIAATKEIAALLIASGADKDARDKDYGMTPLFFHGREIAELLIASGADVNARSKSGITPLLWASNGENDGLVKYFLTCGADVDAFDDSRKTALHVASNWGRVRTAKLLIAHGADVNARDHLGWTPLHWAALEGGVEAARLLLSSGADVNVSSSVAWSKFPAGCTPLDVAKGNGLHDVAELLESHGGGVVQKKTK